MSTTNNLSPDLKKLKQKTFYATLKDGLTELFAGFMLFFMAVILQNPVFITFIALFILFVPKLIIKLKEKYIYPRIGIIEIEPPEDPHGARNGIIFVLSPILIYVLLVVVFERDLQNSVTWLNWLPIMLAMIFLAPTIYLVSNTGKKTYSLFFIVSLALAILMLFVDSLQGYDKISIFLIILGVLSNFTGGVKLWIFIHTNPIQLEEGELVES